MSEVTRFESLDKRALHALCERLLTRDAQAIEECVAFLEVETFGVWHGRARAMIARRLKHCPMSGDQQKRVVDAILLRYTTGRFAEQFKDQLRLVLYLAPERTYSTARSAANSASAHVKRYADWILAHERRT